MKKSFESRYEPKVLPGEEHVKVSVSGLFSAAYDLDKDNVGVILRSKVVDRNSAYSFGQTSSPERPDEHMLQSFSYATCGKVICQILEKIDQGEKADNIFIMLQSIDIILISDVSYIYVARYWCYNEIHHIPISFRLAISGFTFQLLGLYAKIYFNSSGP